MKSFAALGVLALVLAPSALPAVAQTGPNPPAATMPPEPVEPSSSLPHLQPQNRQAAPRVRRVQSTHGAIVTRAPSAAQRSAVQPPVTVRAPAAPSQPARAGVLK